jgi:NADH-quinone oxidoreductase subunit L
MFGEPMDLIIFLIPLLPLMVFVTLVLFRDRIKAHSHRVSIPALWGSFALSFVACVWVFNNGPVRLDLYTFIKSGDLRVDIGLYLDPLSALVLLLVTGVSSLVHVFSSRYMQGDPRYNRFFAVISLFTFAMVMLVMSTNLLMLYFFWEMMGICSYLLISHWAERKSACDSATRVFMVNAVADVGLGLGVLLTFSTFGTLDIQQVLAGVEDAVGQTVNLLGWIGLEWRVEVITVIALLLFWGAMGKSAQFPLHVWLPFAMEAPTPVSALIHAATLVKAGIFLVVRMSPLFVLSPPAMMVVMVIGGITAVFAALIAMTQTDIKRILAYSTMSQLGFMMMACGAGAFIAAVFHLLAHGILKAFLFLSSGSALQHLSDSHHPGHFASERQPLFTGVLALAWLPPVLIALSGYGMLWWTVKENAPSFLFWMMTLGTTFLTALYLYRGFASILNWDNMVCPAEMKGRRGVLYLFLVGIIVTLGLASLLTLIWAQFYRFLSPAVAHGRLDLELVREVSWTLPLLILGLAAALLGWFLAYTVGIRSMPLSLKMSEWYKRFYVLIQNKMYIDEIYDTFVVRPTLGLANWLWQSVDVRIIERLVLGSAEKTMVFARWLWQSVDIRALGWVVDGIARMTLGMARWLWQSVDIRGLERLMGGIGRQNETTGQILREIEPSMLQHQLLAMVFFLVLAMSLFLVFLF